jgi:hypothetical protein
MLSFYRQYKRVILGAAAVLVFVVIALLIFVNRFVEPILKDRLHTLIVQGSDSLYTYTLGSLKANVFGGNVEVEDLQIRVDSSRYEYLRKRNALPSLTMQLSLGRGHIYGLGVMDLLFNKRVSVREIMSGDADLKLSRHIVTHGEETENLPLWKAMRPKIKSIDIERIRLEGVKMNYKNADTSESVKIEFEGCDALFRNIRIDSASAVDTARIGFAQSVYLKIQEAKYRTPDSSYKLKMDTVTYSSEDKTLMIRDFKFQPTLKEEEFYKDKTIQQSMYIIKFDRISMHGVHLDHFIRNNRIDPDQVIFDSADISIYLDRTLLPDFTSKIGRYPHQQLLKASSLFNIKNILLRSGKIQYTEKANQTHQEGVFRMDNLQMNAANITNDPVAIQKDPVCTASIKGTMLGNSPFETAFRFFLDSTNGGFEAKGSVHDVSTAQLDNIARPFANVQVNAFNIHQLQFLVQGEDYSAMADVQMRYNGLSLIFKEKDEETGGMKTKKFITNLVNNIIMWTDNPGPNGVERVARQRKVLRLTTQTFFGFLWKTVFAGMQDIMMKTGS